MFLFDVDLDDIRYFVVVIHTVSCQRYSATWVTSDFYVILRYFSVTFM